NTKKSNNSKTSENISTPLANSNQSFSKLSEENSVQNDQKKNIETQEQMIIKFSSLTSPKVVNENTNNKQNSNLIEVNADSNSKEELFTITILKKSKNKTKKKDESHSKSTRSLRKKNISSDNEIKSKCYQKY
ncbi:1174_t:CDS:1, partial [Scutellospora calospora]